jgi:hypothetical protein
MYQMYQPQLRTVRPCAILGLVLLTANGPASANYYELLRRVPESANTIILIDVERMLMSPIAMKEKWRDKGNSDGVALHFPINAVRYMLASKLDFISNFEDQGDIALIETAEGVSLPYLAKAEGGYLDTIDGQHVAFSPRNAFFVSFKPNILGVSFPANRQELARWLRSAKRLDPPQVSEYLQQAVKLAHGKDHMVVAMDLADLFTPRMVRDRLRRAESLAGKDVDLDTLTRVLATVKGVTLTIAATDRLNGKVRLDLGESAAPIKDVAKALMTEVLEKNDILLPEMRDWRLLLEANAVSLEGRLTSKGLRTLTELIPFPTDTVELKQAGSEQTEGSPDAVKSISARDAKVTASMKYFRRISQRLDDLRTEVKGARKAKFAQKMLNDAAQEIDRLPVLNVDEELLAYGAGVSSSLRNMRNLSKNAGLDYQYRKAQIQGSSGYGYGYGGFYGGGSVAGATTSTYRQESAALQSNELAVLTMLEEKTAEIRKKMTLKYQVEF